MKTNFKKTVTTMSVAAFLMLTAGVVTLGNSLNASAAVTTNENITVEESASLRLENFGLRFKTKIASEYLTEGMEVHTLMLPTSYLAGEELAVGVHSQLADFALDMNKTYQKGTDNYFNTVLTKIPQSQYGTEISMRAYVKNGDTIEYSANTVSTSVASVASSALSYNYELYEADLAKYLVKGISVAEKNTYVVGQKSVSLGAGIEYFVETDETIAEKIAQKYALTYTSSDENVLTVSENGKVTALACGTSNVTVKIEALGLEKTCAVTVTQPSYGEVFDFENPALSMVTVHKDNVQNDALASINEDGKLQVVLDTNGVNYHIRFKGVDGTKLNFDWVKMTYSASYSSGAEANCMILFNGNYMGTATFTGSTSGYTITKSSADNNWDKIKSETNFRIVVQQWRAGDTFTIVFHDIQFGYNDIVADSEENTTFDLTEKFSLTAEELTNVKFNGESVDDVTAFAPTQSGTLTFDVAKEGFATTAMSVNVTYTKLADYGKYVLDDVSKYTSVSATMGTGTFDVNQVTVGEYNALQTEITGGYPWLIITDESLKNLANFENFTLRYKVAYSVSGGSFGIKGTTGDVYNSAKTTATDNGWTLGTWQKEHRPQVFEYLKENGSFRIAIIAWNGAATVTTLTVAEIIGGYNDIVADNEENTTFNLLEKFSLTAEELTNVKFNGVAVADVTAFAPTQSGTLTFDVAKEGFATTSMSVNVTYTQVPRYNPVCCFDNPDLTKASLNSTVAGKVEGSGISMLAGSDANGSYVEFSIKTGSGTFVRFGMSADSAEKLKKYDWFKIKIAAWQYTGATDLTSADAIRQTGTLVTGKTMTVNPHKDNASVANQTINVNGSVYTLEWNRNAFESVFDTLVYGEWSSIGRWFRIVLNSTDTASPAIIRIYDIEFGYNDITSDGTALDLLTKFNATADELTATYTPDGGVAEAITNETAWTPAQSGTLTVTVKKAGYKAFTYTLKVTV